MRFIRSTLFEITATNSSTYARKSSDRLVNIEEETGFVKGFQLLNMPSTNMPQYIVCIFSEYTILSSPQLLKQNQHFIKDHGSEKDLDLKLGIP